MNKSEEIPKILNNVFLQFKEGLFDESISLLEEALKIDFEYKGITSALKCAAYWSERKKKLDSLADRYERAEFLLLQWNQFIQFIGRIEEVSERCLYSIKEFVFGTALACYLAILDDSGIYDQDILLKLGRCYKAIGNYDKAIEFLSLAHQQNSGSSPVLSELADCYSLINEIRISKAMFREAFFIDPGSIDVSTIDSGMIRKLIGKCRELSVPEEELNAWIPVYGTIYGVFNIKRELKSLEFGKLKQAIYTLEKAAGMHFQGPEHDSLYVLQSPETNRIKPVLINHYFWLIDHYICSNEDKARIEEILLKLKYLDANIYHEYMQ